MIPVEAIISAAGVAGLATAVSGWFTARLATSKKAARKGKPLRIELETADGQRISINVDSDDARSKNISEKISNALNELSSDGGPSGSMPGEDGSDDKRG